ncbi:MAG: hypothetical protein ACOX8S_04680 [Christensenellales bacterium]|jgi:hypothetical protein
MAMSMQSFPQRAQPNTAARKKAAPQSKKTAKKPLKLVLRKLSARKIAHPFTPIN